MRSEAASAWPYAAASPTARIRQIRAVQNQIETGFRRRDGSATGRLSRATLRSLCFRRLVHRARAPPPDRARPVCRSWSSHA